MDDVLKLVMLLQGLLPGFVTTIVFYWLAEAPKPSQFERVVQALICSGLIKLFVEGLMNLFLWIGQWWSISNWTSTVEALWSFSLAAAIGLMLAWFALNDKLYAFARTLKLTSRGSTLIQEWSWAFLEYRERFIVLNLLDGRRLMGFPRVWPSDPVKGFFIIEDPFWLEGKSMRSYDGVTSVIISNADILWVEFLNKPEEVV